MPGRWESDRIQFARLLAEIRAVGLTLRQVRDLRISMDLSENSVDELLERAERAWGHIKDELNNEAAIQRARAAAIFDCAEPGEVEFDDDAEVNQTNDGAWVAAWVWIPEERIDHIAGEEHL